MGRRFKLPHIEEPSLRIKAMRYFMTVFCFFFIFFAVGVISVGAVLTSQRPEDCQFLGEYFTGVYLLLAAGCLTGFFSVCTCIFAQKSSSSRNFVSSCNVVIIVVILQIFAAIASHLLYTHASNGDLKSAMNLTWQGYYSGRERCVDYLQGEFECCGLLNDTEWLSLSVNVSAASPYPSSCLCAVNSGKCRARYNTSDQTGSQLYYVHSASCHDEVLSFLFDKLLLIPRILGPLLSFVECLLAVVAIYILHHIDNRSMVGAYVVTTPKTDFSPPAEQAPTELRERSSGQTTARENSCSERRDEAVMHI